ncbi:unnamed protein product [Polarella glacialis]|uniref:Pentatricopeptide repeat-containing protein, chloroplastic n=1 Tax=Polarella glacialis TaxID=89957 RepID=A0A813GN93_POLGL|nr:unnamed protein product [Polarella glacialis]
MTTCRQEAGFVYAAARSATIGAMQSADRSVKDLWQRALGMHSSFSEHFKRPPDAHSYTAAMESCARGGQWQMAAELMRQLHSATSPFQRRDDESLAVGSGLTLQACAEANRWREALVLLVDVQVRRLQAHIAMYDAALASCETGPQSKGDVNEGLWQLAANLLTLARRQGIRSNPFMLRAAVSACKQAKAWEQALRLLQEALASSTCPHDSHYTAALAACERASSWRWSLLLVSSEMPRLGLEAGDGHSLTPRLVALGQSGAWQGALWHLLRARQGGLRLDATACAAAVSAAAGSGQAGAGSAASGGSWQQAVSLLIGLCRLEDGRKEEDALSVAMVSSYAYNNAVTACGRSMRWQAAVAVASMLSSRGLQVGVVECSATLSACQHGKQWARASNLLRAAVRRGGLEPAEAAYNVALATLDRVAGKWEMAFALGNDLLHRGQVSSSVTQNTLLAACARASRWEAALGLLLSKLRPAGHDSKEQSRWLQWQSLPQQQPQQQEEQQQPQPQQPQPQQQQLQQWPNDIAFGTVMDCLDRGGQPALALHLLHEMRRLFLQPNPVVLGAAISSCSRSCRWEHAMVLLKQMHRHGPRPDAHHLSAAVAALGRAHHWQRSVQLLAEARQGRDSLPLPGDVAYGSAINGCGKAHAWSWALQVLQQLSSQSEPPELLRPAAAGGGGGGVAALSKARPKRRLSLAVYGAALYACERANQAQAALAVLEEARAASAEPDAVMYRQVLEVCERNAVAGGRSPSLQTQEAAQLLLRMRHELTAGLRPVNSVSGAGARNGSSRRTDAGQEIDGQPVKYRYADPVNKVKANEASLLAENEELRKRAAALDVAVRQLQEQQTSQQESASEEATAHEASLLAENEELRRRAVSLEAAVRQLQELQTSQQESASEEANLATAHESSLLAENEELRRRAVSLEAAVRQLKELQTSQQESASEEANLATAHEASLLAENEELRKRAAALDVAVRQLQEQQTSQQESASEEAKAHESSLLAENEELRKRAAALDVAVRQLQEQQTSQQELASEEAEAHESSLLAENEELRKRAAALDVEVRQLQEQQTSQQELASEEAGMRLAVNTHREALVVLVREGKEHEASLLAENKELRKRAASLEAAVRQLQELQSSQQVEASQEAHPPQCSTLLLLLRLLIFLFFLKKKQI